MGDTLDFLKLIRVRLAVFVFSAFLLSFMVSSAAFGQQDDNQQNTGNQQSSGNQQNNASQQNTASQPSASFTAEEIIQILQADPDLLAAAKSEIVAGLRNRGYSVSESDISDDRLFSTIRSDDRARQLLSDALVARGYVPEGSQGQQQESQQSPRNGNAAGNQPGNGQSANGRTNTTTGANGEKN